MVTLLAVFYLFVAPLGEFGCYMWNLLTDGQTNIPPPLRRLEPEKNSFFLKKKKFQHVAKRFKDSNFLRSLLGNKFHFCLEMYSHCSKLRMEFCFQSANL